MNPPASVPEFWLQTPLSQLDSTQWEALCDRCAKCCLQKIEDEDTREVYYTNIACHLLNLGNCRCEDYPQRSRRVPDCVPITPELLANPYWLPDTCAYRLLAEHKPLPDWHPLISGTTDSVVHAGHSVCGRVIPEDEADDPEMHLIDWVRC